MSFNPVRAANFGKRHRGNRTYDPHAGTKHSDIMRRQGLGQTIPMSDRTPTATGFAATLMANDKFVVRSEVIGAGNNLGLGSNETQDRLLMCQRGSLFVEIREDNEVSGFSRLQAGSHMSLVKGLVYRICASGTEDSEVLFIEEANYAAGFKFIQAPETKGLSPETVLAASTPDSQIENTGRRTDQSLAKAASVRVAAARVGKQLRGPSSPAYVAAASKQAQANAGKRTVTGATHIGRSPAASSASAVIGVNPQPMGPGSSED